MNEEAQLLSQLWDNVQESIPNSEKQEIAEAMIRTLMEYGNDIRLLADATGTCNYLDRALEEIEEEEMGVDLDDHGDE